MIALKDKNSAQCCVSPVCAIEAHKNDTKPKQGAVVQCIVSLMSSFRGQLLKCLRTLQPNELIFFVKKMREAFALQKLLIFFQQKIMAYFRH